MYVCSSRFLKGTSQRVTESEDILQKFDLSGIDDWDPKIQQEAQDSIHGMLAFSPKMIWI